MLAGVVGPAAGSVPLAPASAGGGMGAVALAVSSSPSVVKVRTQSARMSPLARSGVTSRVVEMRMREGITSWRRRDVRLPRMISARPSFSPADKEWTTEPSLTEPSWVRKLKCSVICTCVARAPAPPLPGPPAPLPSSRMPSSSASAGGLIFHSSWELRGKRTNWSSRM